MAKAAKKAANEDVKENVAPAAAAAASKAEENPAASSTNGASNTDYSEVEEKLAAFKEKGNNQFRKKAYKEAVKHFSEAIRLFEDVGRPLNHGDIKTKITQIYTNRATSLHLLK